MKEEELAVALRKEDGKQNLSISGVLRMPGAAAVAGACASPSPDDVDTTATANFMEWDVTGERGKNTREPTAAAAAFVTPHILKEPHFLTMYDEGDDSKFPSYQHHQLYTQELHRVADAATAAVAQKTQLHHQLYTQELHRVADAATAAVAQKTQEEGAEEDNEEEEEEEEEEEDEEGEDGEGEGEEENVLEDAVDDDEDEEEEEEEEEDDDEDEDDEADEDDRNQDQHNYEQDFELEQRDNRIGVTPNLNHGVESLATADLVSPLPPQQGQQLAGRAEGPQLVVGLDIKPIMRDDWTEPATHALLDAWGERYMQLNKGNLKQEDWEEVALVVTSMSRTHKTDVQCKNRLDTLKKKYKVEKQKQSAIGSSDSKWPFYKKLDKLLSATIKTAGIPGAVDAGHPVKSSAAVDGFRGEQLKGVRKFEVEDSGAAMPPNNASTSSKSKEISSTEHALGTDGTQSSTRKRQCLETPFKTLAKAITKFGEIYEKMEQSKQQQLMDLEKIRMEFTRDLELQRMQLFMQTQVELAKMKHGGNDIDATVSNLSG